MRILISIDDTDNLESRGTGDLAAEIALALEENAWGESSYITRHQLLVHPDIPYTSHNSAMCFAAEVDESHLERIIDHASAFLARESAAGSDPGLCVAAVDRLATPETLVAFGRKAKQSVITMAEANTATWAGRIRFRQTRFSRLEKALSELGIARVDGLVADLGGVSYTSSAGLRALLAILKAVRHKKGDLRLACVQPNVHKVLEMSGFTSIFKLFEDVDAAVASFGTG